MAISIAHPLSASDVNPTLTANGSYTYTDVDRTKPAECTMTPAAGTPVVRPIEHCADGVWRATFVALANGTYRCDAYYTKSNGTRVDAVAQTEILVTPLAPAVMVTPCMSPPTPVVSPPIPGAPGAPVAFALPAQAVAPPSSEPTDNGNTANSATAT